MKQKNTNMVVFCVIKADTFPIKRELFILLCSSKTKKIPKALLSFWETVECVLQVTIKISEITENTFCVAEITSTKLIHQWHDRDLCTMLML